MKKNNDFSDFSEHLPQKKFPWVAVNAVIAVLGFLSSCVSAMILISALGITEPMILIDILLNIFLAIFYKKWRKIKDFQWQKGRRLRTAVIILRIFAIIAIILTYSIPFIAVNSNLSYVKPMYQVKKFIYCNGVYNGYMDEFLPEKLPKVCEDYKFITQVGTIAQDYHPSAYLIFRTDTATMHELEEDYKKIDGAKLVEVNVDIEEYKRKYGDDYMEYIPEYPKQFPGHVYSRLDDEHIDDFFDAVIYEIPSYCNKGCIFDYSSGLVVYWT